MVVKRAQFVCDELFHHIADLLKSDDDALKQKLKGVYRFEVKNSEGDSGCWTVSVNGDDSGVERDSDKKADVTLTLSDNDLVQVMTGQLDSQKAFFQGKLRLKGNMAMALKLRALQPQLAQRRSKL